MFVMNEILRFGALDAPGLRSVDLVTRSVSEGR